MVNAMAFPSATRLQRAQRAVLLGTTFLFPILVLPGVTQDEFKVPKMVLLLLGVGLAGAIHLIRIGRGTAERIDRRMVAIGGSFIALLTISWSLSDLKQWALVGQYYRYQGLLPYVLFLGYGLLIATSFKGKPRPVAWALVLSAAATGMYSVIQAFHLDPLFIVGGSGIQPAFSSIGNTNFAGGWHAIALPVALGLFASEHGRGRDIALLTCWPISLGIVLSFSQGGWVAATGGTVAFIGMLVGRSRPTLRTVAFGAAGALGVLVVAIVVSVVVSSEASEIFGPTVQERAWGWQAAIESWRSAPFVGRGPNTFALFSYQYQPIEARVVALDYLDDPHSVPLFFLASSGLAGAIGYISMLLAFLWLTIATAVRRSEPLLMGLAAGVIAYAIQILVSIDDPTLRLALWAIVPAVLAADPAAAVPDGAKRARPMNITAALVAAMVLAGTAVVASWRSFEADRQVRVGVDAALDNNAEQAVQAFDRAVELRDDYWYRYLAGQKTGELANRRAPEGAELFADMREHFRSPSVPRHPRDLFIEGILTTVWAEKAAPSLEGEGFSLVRRAHRLDQGNITYAVGLAMLLIDSGRHMDAVNLLEDYLAYNPPDVAFWNTWVLANAAAGNQQEAWNTISSMNLSPADPRVRRALELLIN